ncbi:helix-turn-helix domain-containing protein [Caballeronia sp. LZ043]|uniref:helix-turn-helix domain-containing protein n=1 Tax=Caballeronia sp. LZ043 TaxID=3038569 RepID=UPI002856409D|nr:helix-turn-helix domain-containing protein [Caballeronia sp. LZ043]MDR5822325.1 helix-turn-helix domain-containing protein [Caballeronia sp. LZ043]
MTIIVVFQNEGSVGHECATQALRSIDLEVCEDDVFVGASSAATPARERPTLRCVIDRLWPTDIVVVFDLASLGNGYCDVLDTLRMIAEKGAAVACLSRTDAGWAVVRHETLLAALTLVADLDRKVRTLRARDASRRLRDLGAKLGRPESLSAELQRQALDALAAGSTVSDIARALNTSRQTILRLRRSRNISEGDS